MSAATSHPWETASPLRVASEGGREGGRDGGREGGRRGGREEGMKLRWAEEPSSEATLNKTLTLTVHSSKISPEQLHGDILVAHSH